MATNVTPLTPHFLVLENQLGLGKSVNMPSVLSAVSAILKDPRASKKALESFDSKFNETIKKAIDVAKPVLNDKGNSAALVAFLESVGTNVDHNGRDAVVTTLSVLGRHGSSVRVRQEISNAIKAIKSITTQQGQGSRSRADLSLVPPLDGQRAGQSAGHDALGTGPDAPQGPGPVGL